MAHVRLLTVLAAIGLLIPARVSGAESVSIFFQSEAGFVAVPRDVAAGADPLEAALAELAAGPTAEERGAGITSAIPDGTEVLTLTVTDDVVAVDFSDQLVADGIDDARIEGVFQQTSWTLEQFPPRRDVRLSVAGAPLWSYLQPDPTIKPGPPIPKAQPARPILTLGTGTALAGRHISLSPGHGRVWNGSSWVFERPVYCAPLNREDDHNVELVAYLNTYLMQDGADTEDYRCLDKSFGTHPIGEPWWRMSAGYWIQHRGYPCSVYASSTGDCVLGSGSSESSDSLRSRPLASDYDDTDIYLSMHTNGYQGDCLGSGCPNGTGTYYDASATHAPWAAVSLQLAQSVQSAMVDVIRTHYGDASWRDRGTPDADGAYAETRIPDRAAVLIELAFHDSCDRDAAYLRDNFFRSATMWGVYKGVCNYFGTTPTYAFYSDEYVSDTIPSVMQPGQAYPVSITFRNRGVLWTEARQIRLGAVGDSDPFTSFTRVTIAGEVGPGETYTFNFTMTAPTVEGAYVSDWRMVRDGVTWFGVTHSENIVVGTSGPFPPAIVQQPQSRSVPEGGTADFTVSAAGDPPLSYRWSRDGVDLSNGPRVSGADSPTLEISYVTTDDQGDYLCLVSNPYGTQYSAPARLSVTSNVFMVESRSGGQNVGKYSELGVWADSGGKSSAAGTTAGIGSRYGSTYRSVAGLKQAFFRADLPAAGQYEVFATWSSSGNRRNPVLHRVTHAAGIAERDVDQAAVANQWVSLGTYPFNAGTNTGTVEVTNEHIDVSGSMYADAVKWEYRGSGVQAPTITQHPQARHVCPGGSADFTVAASGSGTLFYQWQKGGVDLSDGGHYAGTAKATLTVSDADGDDVGSYTCVVSNIGGGVASSAAALTLKTATSVSQQPLAQSVPAHDTAQFTVAAAGEGSLSYRWQKDRVDLADGAHYSGTATATLTVIDVGASEVGLYRCVVTGECGAVPSEEAALSLSGPPPVPGDFDGDLDVDQSDFGYFQVCLTGDVAPQTDPACQEAHMDADTDVDQTDLALFVGCMTAPNVPGDADCVEQSD